MRYIRPPFHPGSYAERVSAIVPSDLPWRQRGRDPDTYGRSVMWNEDSRSFMIVETATAERRLIQQDRLIHAIYGVSEIAINLEYGRPLYDFKIWYVNPDPRDPQEDMLACTSHLVDPNVEEDWASAQADVLFASKNGLAGVGDEELARLDMILASAEFSELRRSS